MNPQTDPLEINRFEFAHLKNSRFTDVTLDLTRYTDECWQEGILSFFEIPILQGSRTVSTDRVLYKFRLKNDVAKVLESAIVNAMIEIQGQQN